MDVFLLILQETILCTLRRNRIGGIRMKTVASVAQRQLKIFLDT